MQIPSMRISNLYKLHQYRAKAAVIEKQWTTHRRKLLGLPSQLGYNSLKELILALKYAEREGLPIKPNMKRKERALVTEEIIKEVQSLILAKVTGREIAKRLDLSIATVQNIKAKLGLVQKSKR